MRRRGSDDSIHGTFSSAVAAVAAVAGTLEAVAGVVDAEGEGADFDCDRFFALISGGACENLSRLQARRFPSKLLLVSRAVAHTVEST
jgi:hypothetical protein